jgi:hypothetical protein
MDIGRPIDELFFSLLTNREKQRWNEEYQKATHKSFYKKLRRNLSVIKIGLKGIKLEW